MKTVEAQNGDALVPSRNTDNFTASGSCSVRSQAAFWASAGCA